MTLLEFIRSTAASWSQEGEAGSAFFEQAGSLRERIHSLYSRYEPPAPAGAEEVRELMLEALDSFARALDCLEQHCDVADPQLLTQAVELAQEGDDILQSIHHAIEQSQQMITISDE